MTTLLRSLPSTAYPQRAAGTGKGNDWENRNQLGDRSRDPERTGGSILSGEWIDFRAAEAVRAEAPELDSEYLVLHQRGDSLRPSINILLGPRARFLDYGVQGDVGFRECR